MDDGMIKGWRKASACASSASCVEVKFAKSSFCGSAANCVEVGGDGAAAYMRDSKDQDGPVLEFSREAWTEFLAEARSGGFNAAQ